MKRYFQSEVTKTHMLQILRLFKRKENRGKYCWDVIEMPKDRFHITIFKL